MAHRQQHGAGLARRVGQGQGAAQHGQKHGRIWLCGRPGSGARFFPHSLGNEVFGPGYVIDHLGIGALGVVGKGEDPVVHEDDAVHAHPAFVEAGHLLGQGKARHDEGQDTDLRPQGLTQQGLAVDQVGEGDDGVGVGVVDKGMRQEGMHQGLDGGVGRGGAPQVGAELIDHLLVGERLQAPQFAEITQIQGREAGRLDGGQVPAAALDEQHLHLLAQQGGDPGLGRGVAAAVQDKARFGTDEP